jgi:CheY-like chemotaxis protein
MIRLRALEWQGAGDSGSEQRVPEDSRAVLVVEDDADLRAWMVRVLRRAGHAVLEAPDGWRALHVIEQHEPPDAHIGLILLDLLLPFLSGVEMIRGLADELGSIPVVAVSGSQQELAEASAAGATDVLAKPFTADQMLDMVARYWPLQRDETPE